MAAPYRHNDLRWPLTPEGLKGLDQEIDALYRQVRQLHATAIGDLDADRLASGTVPAARMPAFTGDVTTVAGHVATTLASTGVTPGAYGDSTHVPQLTLDAKGRVTLASSVALVAPTIAVSVLTNGDPAAPELIYDSFGDVIMVIN